jgi:hypothetical protein
VENKKSAFTSENALMKRLFLAQQNICSKWNRPVHNRGGGPLESDFSPAIYYLCRQTKYKYLTMKELL